MIKCGFFNSVGNDRLYNAEDMNEPYKMLISNGVFATPEGTASDYLQVFADDGLTVNVRAGRGIFADKWFVSDTVIPLTLDAGVANPRIDSVIVRIDTSETGRFGEIVVKKGTPATSPSAPVMERSATVSEYRLANITVGRYATAITQAEITDKRGSSDCGWVTSLIKQVDTSTLYVQWETAFNDWFSSMQQTFRDNTTFVKQYSTTVTNLVSPQTHLDHGLTYYTSELDILQVYLNGFMLIEGTDYTRDGYTGVNFTRQIDVGSVVRFLLWKTVDGSEYENLISIQEQLYGKQDKLTAGRNIAISSSNVISANVGEYEVYSDIFWSSLFPSYDQETLHSCEYEVVIVLNFEIAGCYTRVEFPFHKGAVYDKTVKNLRCFVANKTSDGEAGFCEIETSLDRFLTDSNNQVVVDIVDTYEGGVKNYSTKTCSKIYSTEYTAEGMSAYLLYKN